MLRLRSLFVAMAAVFPSTAGAQRGGPFGLGIILGDPSGLSGKLKLDGTHAIDGALAFSAIDEVLYVHADYLFHGSPLRAQGLSGHRFVPYVGIGGFIGVFDERKKDRDTDGAIGARVPLGIAWQPPIAVDVFLEVVPLMRIVPETDAGLDVGLGVRYFF